MMALTSLGDHAKKGTTEHNDQAYRDVPNRTSFWDDSPKIFEDTVLINGPSAIRNDRYYSPKLAMEPTVALARTVEFPAARASFWQRYVLPPNGDWSAPTWHISPVIDMAAYHFSWIWVLVPMILASGFLGAPDQIGISLYILALVIGVNLAHRHFGLPYAYFDDEVFRTHRLQLIWFPLVCIALLAATPVLLNQKIAGPIGAGTLNAIVFFAVLWNIWHVYMQKFGILRLYMAKDPAPTERKTVAWVDKYFLLCWFPLYLSYLAPKYKNLILDRGQVVAEYTSVIIRFMEKHEAGLVAPSALVAVGGVGLWLWHEWRAHQFQNRARLSAGGGTLLILTALFWTNPVTAYIAFGFSHALEYMTFVWAFQRRRYRRPQSQHCLMARLLRCPTTWYTAFIVVFIAAGILQVLWGRTILTTTKPIMFLGLAGRSWVLYYAVYQSLVHFYMDGFLWKMRRPEVRGNI
jgi:hypothetical protein